jgi:hypothetical protein
MMMMMNIDDVCVWLDFFYQMCVPLLKKNKKGGKYKQQQK